MSAAVGVRRSRRLRAYARRVTGLQFSDSEAENAEPREAEERDNHSDAENTDPAEIEQPDARGAERPCIDLTGEDDDEPPVVDLTSPALERTFRAATFLEPVVITRYSRAPRRRLSPPRRRRRVGEELQLNSDSDDELPNIPPTTPNHPKPSSSTTTTSPLSPEGLQFSCPICMDGISRIRRSGRRLFSTVCGHLFCDQCIQDAVRAQRKCPTCRKQLTLKQTHPVFL